MSLKKICTKCKHLNDIANIKKIILDRVIENKDEIFSNVNKMYAEHTLFRYYTDSTDTKDKNIFTDYSGGKLDMAFNFISRETGVNLVLIHGHNYIRIFMNLLGINEQVMNDIYHKCYDIRYEARLREAITTRLIDCVFENPTGELSYILFTSPESDGRDGKDFQFFEDYFDDAIEKELSFLSRETGLQFDFYFDSLCQNGMKHHMHGTCGEIKVKL